MIQTVKKTLEKQLELLSERSKEAEKLDDFFRCTDQMLHLCKAIIKIEGFSLHSEDSPWSEKL